MSKRIPSIPGASRTINALSDMGYDLNSAVADIIDNSISRGCAKNIYIDFRRNSVDKFQLVIIDDGIGMNSLKLEEAMRIGSKNDGYVKGDLSKYGMGMKTASMSQSSLITVLSKMNDCTPTAFRWDLKHVDITDKWEIFRLKNSEIQRIKDSLTDLLKENKKIHLSDIFQGNSWTIVIWEDLVNFQKNFDSYSSTVTAENFYFRIFEGLKKYISLVFHRFLSGEGVTAKTRIFLNSFQIKALDPFCRNEEHTIEMPLKENHGNYIIKKDLSPIIIKRFILPTNPKKPGNFRFSSIEAWDEASGTKSWNESQGYYVYRNNRLMSWGGWFRTKALDEHDKLARASIDLTDEHDDLFTLDVKKTRIQFPEELRNHLKDNVNSKFIAEAKKRYAGSEKRKNDVTNVVRSKNKQVSHLSSSLVKEDNITVEEAKSKYQVIINNKFGQKVSDDLTYKMLDASQKIISTSFGSKDLFWKMVPSPHNEFQVLVNTDHPFYDLVYGDSNKDKKLTAIMDAFLFTMSFVELKCITNNNEMLFDQMKEVASTVLFKFIDEKIL
jgi:hypothetical protein